MTLKQGFILFICFLGSGYCFGQGQKKDSISKKDTTKASFTISGYAELYYSYDTGQPKASARPDFFYSFNKHNEPNVNIAFLKGAYQAKRFRANLALMIGTYSTFNLAAEPEKLKNLMETNVGVKLSKKKNLWLDAGVFASHIGFESAVGKDCWNLTRSLLAENSPYYESGIKLTYISPAEKWLISGLVLNGWQRIRYETALKTPALGHQVTYKPNAKITLNSSSFVGSETPDSALRMRYFHNFYCQYQANAKLGLLLGFDCGMQQQAIEKKQYHLWYSPVAIVRYAFFPQLHMALRGEYYYDPHQVKIYSGTANGFQTLGYSLNFDYSITPNLVWRIEGRGLSSKDKVFSKEGSPTFTNYFFTTSLAVWF